MNRDMRSAIKLLSGIVATYATPITPAAASANGMTSQKNIQ